MNIKLFFFIFVNNYLTVLKNIMKNIIKLFYICTTLSLLLTLSACKKNKQENENLQNGQKTLTDTTEATDTGKLHFAGCNWLVNTDNTEPNINSTALYEENVFLDSSGKLHLKTGIINGEPAGAEISVDSLLDYGEYTFFIDTKLSSFPKNCELFFRFCNPDDKAIATLTETGIAIGFENSNIKNPIKYYAYNSLSKEPEKHYLNVKIKNDTNGTIHKIILVNEAITFISQYANSKNNNTRNSASLISEYTFSKFQTIRSKNELTFFKPNRKQKLVIGLYYSDIDQPTEEFEVVISKIIFKSSNSGVANVAAR